MRYLSIILFVIFSLSADGQGRIQFETGDHIYYFESLSSIPHHYQVCPNDRQCVDFIHELYNEGPQECILAFDPITEYIYPNGHYFNKQDSIYIIPTPYLRKATSFEVYSKNRVFLILKTAKKEL